MIAITSKSSNESPYMLLTGAAPNRSRTTIRSCRAQCSQTGDVL